MFVTQTDNIELHGQITCRLVASRLRRTVLTSSELSGEKSPTVAKTTVAKQRDF